MNIVLSISVDGRSSRPLPEDTVDGEQLSIGLGKHCDARCELKCGFNLLINSVAKWSRPQRIML